MATKKIYLTQTILREIDRRKFDFYILTQIFKIQKYTFVKKSHLISSDFAQNIIGIIKIALLARISYQYESGLCEVGHRLMIAERLVT